MTLQLFTFLVFFTILFFTITILNLLNYSAKIWAQISEFQSLLIIGNISAVNNNYTVGVNNNLLVSLAFVNQNTTDEIIFQDGIHFISVVCPIRSPVIVLPISNTVNFVEDNSYADLTKFEGMVFCQTSYMSDLNTTKSGNEQLIDAKLGTLNSSKICNSGIFLYLQSTRIIDC